MKKSFYQACWKFRPPPGNPDTSRLCPNAQCCIFGDACTAAHSADELKEWHVRYHTEQVQQQRTMVKTDQSSVPAHIQHIKDTINEGKRLGLPHQIMLAEVSGLQRVLCKQNLFVTHVDKNKEISWQFHIDVRPAINGSIHGLQNVFFLEDNCPEFSFTGLSLHPNEKVRPLDVKELRLETFAPIPPPFAALIVKFSTSFYGNFNVSVIFDFGYAPRIVRYLGVVVAPEKHLVTTLYLKPHVDCEQNSELAWLAKHKLVTFESSTVYEAKASTEDPYTLPSNLKYGVEYGAFEHLDVELTRDNYRDRLHTLLYVEEYERRKRMSRLNVHCEDIFSLFRTGPRPRSMKYIDMKKTLFIAIAEEILEEVGILVSRGSKALLRIRQFVYCHPEAQDYVLHEALVVNILSDEIVVELSTKTFQLLSSMTGPLPVDICFRFVNTFQCMHSAIDRVNLDLIFNIDTPEVPRSVPSLPHSTLSPAQVSAVSRLLKSPPGAPILLLGPFGTGKTQTLAEAVKILISRKNAKPSSQCRVLICTHSNSAADHYIEDYLHAVYEDLKVKDPSVVIPLRVYWEHRLAMTITDKIMPYCLMDFEKGTFRNPTLAELEQRTVVVTTLVTADVLVKCGVTPGFFTHIFIDEAAQAMELETLIPISLATKHTKVVLAGDHLQLGPPVFSTICRKLLLDKSLLVRLYELFPANSLWKFVLLENYRSYKEIVDIPSKLFYGGTLVSKKPSPPGSSYPVQFYGVQGFEEKSSDSLSFINMPEVAEISERVEDVIKSWPRKDWGDIDLRKMCVLCAHHAQMRQIRRELRINGFSSVRVENVHNVQGLEFDVLFLSTVRTSRQLAPGEHEGKDLGLLSNPKLLNTAITRAKYSLIIVGDPKALCSVGNCRVCWKTILSLCSEKGTFHSRVPLSTVLTEIREDQTRAIVAGSPVVNVAPQIRPMNPQGVPLIPQGIAMSPKSFHLNPQGIPMNPQRLQDIPMNSASLHTLNRNPYLPPFWPAQYPRDVAPFQPAQLNSSPGTVGNPHSPQEPLEYGNHLPNATPNVQYATAGKLSYSLEEKQATGDTMVSSCSSGGGDLIKTLRHNIRATLKMLLDNEEAVQSCIEQPLENTVGNIQENLERQLTLIRSQKTHVDQQQRLNNELEKNVREWQQRAQGGGEEIRKDLVLGDKNQRNVQPQAKVNLSDDSEVREWHEERRHDPIVQDYIKSFEALSERARRAEIAVQVPITEACEISEEKEHELSSTTSNSLRGWVLQPDSVVYASGCCFYEEHITSEKAQEGVGNGDLVSCQLVVDRSSGGNSAFGIIDDPSVSNIYIPDRKTMNRAFHNDKVAVQVTKHDGRKQQRHGKVVAILNEHHSRRVVCRLSSPESNSMIPLNPTNPRFVILQSENHIGKIGVAVFDLDASTIKFQMFISDVKDKLFLIQLLKWDASYQFPLGFVVECFDECAGSPADSLSVLYADYDIQKDFPADVFNHASACFPESWRIPEEERRSRRLYDDVFTIDAEGAEELDDAVSVRPVGYGVYCVTVHVADVSYFVAKGSPLDRNALRRASSTYLPACFHESVPLLPRRLSHDLCSLIPGEERLAVSVEFRLDSCGNLLETAMFHRSIVVSQQRFNYDEVDVFLQQPSHTTADVSHLAKMTAPLLKSVVSLRCLTQEMWSRRVRRGSYQACSTEADKSPSRRIIEELMILTNTEAAKRLMNHSADHAVPLRLQMSPKYSALQDVVTWAADEEGVDLREMFATAWLSEFCAAVQKTSADDVSVPLTMWRSICQAIKITNMVDLTNAILNVHENSPLKSVMLAIQRLMPKSKYVSSSQCAAECRHFALNIDSYTHFTSPIRRYFDIIVHRVLLSESPVYEDDELEALCESMNLACERVNTFTKHCATFAKTVLLHETSPWKPMDVETPSCAHLTMRSTGEEPSSQPIKLHIKDMGVVTKDWNEDVHELLVSWTFRDLDLQFGADLAAHDSSVEVFELASTNPVSETMVKVPVALWCELLVASREESMERLVLCRDAINERAVTSLNTETTLPQDDDGVSVDVDELGVSSVTRFFRRGDKLQGFFHSSSFSGVSRPFLQAIQIAPGKVCCVQHLRKPIDSFTQPAKLRTREKYVSVNQYLSIHVPLLLMESAARSVPNCVLPLQLRNATVNWITDPVMNVRRGTLRLPKGILLPSTKIHKDDFICVRSSSVISHGHVHGVASEDDDILLELVLIPKHEIPVSGLCTIEIIAQDVGCRRMVSCVRDLKDAPEDVHSLILKRDWSSPRGNPSRQRLTSPFTLDPDQRKAVDTAINSSFALIEGLPGTGKTYTAAAIAEQFVLANLQEKSNNVLFCCATDQAVEIAAKMLLCGSPRLPVLRVYSREVEAQWFPEIAAAYGVHTTTGASGVATGANGVATGATGDSGVATGLAADNGVTTDPTASGVATGPTGNSGVATGDSGVTTGHSDVATGRSGVATGHSDVATGHSDVATGRSGVTTGHSDVATGRSDVATGRSGVTTGHSDVATGPTGDSSVIAGPTGASAVATSSIGDSGGQSCQLQKHALHRKIRSDGNPFGELVKKCTQRINTLKEYSGNRDLVYKALDDYRYVVKMAEQYELSARACIIFTTCLEAGSSRIRKHGNVKQCVLDESNMCLEAEILVVLQAVLPTCNQVVLVGDRAHLAPIVRDKTARRFGLGKSLFQSLLDARQRNTLPFCTLNTNYRMHPSIGQFIASVFYKDQHLKDASIVSTRRDIGQITLFWRNTTCRTMLYHVCGEQKSGNGHSITPSKETSLYNEEEMKRVIDVVNNLKEKGVGSTQISILTPYSGQEILLQTYLKNSDMEDIKVCSFIAAQGSENDFVIISTVRSLDRSEIVPSAPPEWLDVYLGVLTDQRQANVALTRARHGLILVGDQDLLAVCPGWSDFVTFCKENDCVVTEFP